MPAVSPSSDKTCRSSAPATLWNPQLQVDVQKQGGAQRDKQGRGWLRRVMDGIPVRGDVERVKDDSRRRMGGGRTCWVGRSEGQCSPSHLPSPSSAFHSLPGANELLMAVEQLINPPPLSPLRVSFPSLPLPTCPPAPLFRSRLPAPWQGSSLVGSHSPPSVFVSRF